MDPQNCPAGRIRPTPEAGIPLQGGLTGTGDGILPRHALDSGFAGRMPAEVLFENLSIEVGLFGLRGLLSKSKLRLFQLLVGDTLRGVILDGVDPGIPDTVGKLLLEGGERC